MAPAGPSRDSGEPRQQQAAEQRFFDQRRGDGQRQHQERQRPRVARIAVEIGDEARRHVAARQHGDDVDRGDQHREADQAEQHIAARRPAQRQVLGDPAARAPRSERDHGQRRRRGADGHDRDNESVAGEVSIARAEPPERCRRQQNLRADPNHERNHAPRERGPHAQRRARQGRRVGSRESHCEDEAGAGIFTPPPPCLSPARSPWSGGPSSRSRTCRHWPRPSARTSRSGRGTPPSA